MSFNLLLVLLLTASLYFSIYRSLNYIYYSIIFLAGLSHIPSSSYSLSINCMRFLLIADACFEFIKIDTP